MTVGVFSVINLVHDVDWVATIIIDRVIERNWFLNGIEGKGNIFWW